jgi:hypothetical protein
MAGGLLATLQNAGMVLSIGIFFSLMVAGLAASLPHTLDAGLLAHGVPAASAHRAASAPPVGSLFAAFLGYNPLRTLLGPALGGLSAANRAALSSTHYFPQLISGPFKQGLIIVFGMAAGLTALAALISWLRGPRYMHVDVPLRDAPAEGELVAAEVP